MSASGGAASSTVNPSGVAGDFMAPSANMANGVATANIPAVAGKQGFISGFYVTATGATAAATVQVLVTGLQNTIAFVFVFPGDPTAPAVPLLVSFPRPLPASAVNTAITVTLPASGLGGLNARVVITGFYQ